MYQVFLLQRGYGGCDQFLIPRIGSLREEGQKFRVTLHCIVSEFTQHEDLSQNRTKNKPTNNIKCVREREDRETERERWVLGTGVRLHCSSIADLV